VFESHDVAAPSPCSVAPARGGRRRGGHSPAFSSLSLTKFCVVGYTSGASTAMVVLDPTWDQAVGLLNGSFTGVDDDMYETDAKTETIEGLSPAGAVAWKSTIVQLFGPGFDTNNGWYFASYGTRFTFFAAAVGWPFRVSGFPYSPE
jgi:hypothetical protein